MYTDAQLLPISALQHLLFCERQCALIHLERLWAENRLTVEGRQLHKKAHNPRPRNGPPSRNSPPSRDGVRTTRGVELVSHRLGLFGVADVIEYREGVPLPVEYKRGRPKKHDADLVQLCAQALCLEEMLSPASPPILAGAIFYGQTRRRLDVPLDAALRARTEAAAARLHEMIASGVTPIARREKKCDRCSLLHLCLPDALRPRKGPSVYLREAAAEVLAMA